MNACIVSRRRILRGDDEKRALGRASNGVRCTPHESEQKTGAWQTQNRSFQQLSEILRSIRNHQRTRRTTRNDANRLLECIRHHQNQFLLYPI